MIIKRSLIMLCAICFAIICAKSPIDNKKNSQVKKLIWQKLASLKKQASKESDSKKKEELEKRCEELAKRINS